MTERGRKIEAIKGWVEDRADLRTAVGAGAAAAVVFGAVGGVTGYNIGRQHETAPDSPTETAQPVEETGWTAEDVEVYRAEQATIEQWIEGDGRKENVQNFANRAGQAVVNHCIKVGDCDVTFKSEQGDIEVFPLTGEHGMGSEDFPTSRWGSVRSSEGYPDAAASLSAGVYFDDDGRFLVEAGVQMVAVAEPYDVDGVSTSAVVEAPEHPYIMNGKKPEVRAYRTGWAVSQGGDVLMSGEVSRESFNSGRLLTEADAKRSEEVALQTIARTLGME